MIFVLKSCTTVKKKKKKKMVRYFLAFPFTIFAIYVKLAL